MFKTVQEAFEYLVRQYRQNTGKFPIGKQIEDLMRQAEDYMSKPQFTVRQTQDLPKADIENIPLEDPNLRAQAIRKKLEARNVQVKGEETMPGERGKPEAVPKDISKFRNRFYVPKSEMKAIMMQAEDELVKAQKLLAEERYAEADGILRNMTVTFKYPSAVRDAADDIRSLVRRDGLDYDPEFTSKEEAIMDVEDKFQNALDITNDEYNYPSRVTRTMDDKDVKEIEFFDDEKFDLDELKEYEDDPNLGITSLKDVLDDFSYAEGGRVGYSAGGIIKALETMYKGADISYFVDLLDQAKKAGIPIKNLKDLFNFEKQVQEAGGKVYESRKSFPGVEGEKSGLPVDDEMLVPKTNLQKVRNKVQKDKEGIQQLADEGQIPVRDDTVKSEYKFTGRETQDDLYELEEKGIISRADHNVYGDRYLDYLDAKVKYYYGYTKGQMNKIKNQPARLNYLRAQVDPNWAEANFGEDYLPMLEKARGEEIKIKNPGKDKSGPFDHIFEKMYKPVRDEIDEADKIPGEEPLQKTKNKRTLNASGGLAYLMGL